MDTSKPVAEDARVTLAAAVAVWGATILGASASGLFGKLDFEEAAALTAFVTLFALATYFLDPSIRAFVDALRYRGVTAIALGAAVLLAWPHVAAVLFTLPLAAVAAATALSHRRARVTSPAAKSPGARPAAT